MDIQIGNWEQLNWLWLVAAVLATLVVVRVVRRHAIRRFATAGLLQRLVPGQSAGRLAVRCGLPLLAMALLTLALIDMRWGRTWRDVPQRGMEVMFALDVSRSMLAEDVAPNRLERAKQQIADMVDEMAGDRVGLVVFAGESRKQIPLTRHYLDFKAALNEVGPWDVDRGGSDLATALQTAADAFLDKTGDHKAIVVFSDGEDQENDPAGKARELLQDKGIRVHTVGIGDAETGARIPVAGRGGSGWLQYNGQTVWSQLDGNTLEQMAAAGGGTWIPAETRQVDMGDAYHRFVASAAGQDFETARINSYIPRYQWFVGLALATCLASVFWPHRSSRPDRPAAVTPAGQYSASSRQPENAAQGVAA